MSNAVSVIDLFAGPGGLAEGFARFTHGPSRIRPFKIAVSFENEPGAYQTLKLRSFFRQFGDDVPTSYYQFLKGELGATPDEQLYRLPENREAVELAGRDARQITLGTKHAEVYRRVQDAIGNGECIIIGGPPCQAYSVIGRSRNYGDRKKKYSPADDPRNYLYKEYLRLIARFQPLAFVMENVKGILSATINGKRVFDSIIADLQDPCRAVTTTFERGRHRHRYRLFSFVNHAGKDLLGNSELLPAHYIISCEKYGVPQARERVIVLGIREDLVDKHIPQLLVPASTTVSIDQAIGDLPRVRSGLSKQHDTAVNWLSAVQQIAKIDELDKKCIWPELTKLNKPRADRGCEFGLRRSPAKSLSGELGAWYFDANLGTHITNHVTRGHIESDLHRYFFLASIAKHRHCSLTATDLPKSLWPKHGNFGSGKFADRFRVQLSGRPASTVTSHISKDGHYYIHPDPTQCRSFTVREAARIQTFPDNYFFVGSRTQQYVQVGNAVPPFLARQLAKVVFDVIHGISQASDVKNTAN